AQPQLRHLLDVGARGECSLWACPIDSHRLAVVHAVPNQRLDTLPKSRAIGARMTGRAAAQATPITSREAKKIQKPVQSPARPSGAAEPRAAYMWLGFLSAPVVRTSETWVTMKTTK